MKKYEVRITQEIICYIVANNEIAAENQAWEQYNHSIPLEVEIRVKEVKQRKEKQNAKPRRK